MSDPIVLQPSCARCGRRHLPDLRCWSGRYALRMLALVIATYGDTCCHCGKRGANSTEHVHPRSHGGTDTIGNLLPAHLPCNLERGTKPMAGYGTRPITTTASGRW